MSSLQQLQTLLQQKKALNLAVSQCIDELELDALDSQSKKTDLNSIISGAMINEIKLQDHTIATMPEHFKEQYVALLIHALKTATPLLSEAQYTLLGLLLRSMKLPQKNSAYFESSQEINSDFLLRFKEANISDSAASFMMDLMLIARIPGNFSAQSLQLFSQLSELLGLTAKQLREIDEWCAYLLGLSKTITIEKINIQEDIGSASHSDLGEKKAIITEVNTGMINGEKKPLLKYSIDTSSKWYEPFSWGRESNKSNSETLKKYTIQSPAPLGYFVTTKVVGEEIEFTKKSSSSSSSSSGRTTNSWISTMSSSDVPEHIRKALHRGVSASNDQSSEENILLGHYYPLPHFALFWLSFIDFDALIQGQ
ncbi:hypothetical protein WMO13_08590 [Ignatzschineria larvae DSM 13226]|uniref:Uncharacterized protein n=1 Tax=Ignatzschineria larvae DSM 13226 TaxID=1111732 RepID=A0ABZ3C2Z4_9GAMM|nr:hypothetical protein [Ignatzschineria larvae]